ncbi:hypothetical protein SDC9_167578 [bioreactor metagenome]|uniref:Uncharacterized protein n=1 Tax=bioreactor metagenome TaxID=1076179 RepID=A0A645G2S2_9ZZZZ
MTWQQHNKDKRKEYDGERIQPLAGGSGGGAGDGRDGPGRRLPERGADRVPGVGGSGKRAVPQNAGSPVGASNGRQGRTFNR